MGSCIFAHDSTQSGSGEHGPVIIGHPVFLHGREGALAWCWALILILLRGQESMELYLHSFILFHDILPGWASGGPLLVFRWLQTTVLRYAYLCSYFSLWTVDFFYSSADIRQVFENCKTWILNSTGFIFPVVWWQTSLCYRFVANSWLLQTV
jgi:hypothetical protein